MKKTTKMGARLLAALTCMVMLLMTMPGVSFAAETVLVNHTFDENGNLQGWINNAGAGTLEATGGEMVMNGDVTPMLNPDSGGWTQDAIAASNDKVMEISFDFRNLNTSSWGFFLIVYDTLMIEYAKTDTDTHHVVITYDTYSGAYTTKVDGVVFTSGTGSNHNTDLGQTHPTSPNWKKRFHFRPNTSTSAVALDNFTVKLLVPSLEFNADGSNIASGATEVAVDKTFTLDFGVAVDEDTLSGITLQTAAGSTVGINTSANANIITVDPTNDLKYATDYVLTVPTTLKDTNGNALEAAVTVNFKTVSHATVVLNHTFDSGIHDWVKNNGNVAAENGKLVMSSDFSAIYNCSADERSKIDGSLVEISFDFQRTTASSTAISFNVYNADMLTFTDSDTNLHHFVVTYDASTGAYIVNKDGVLIVPDGNGAPSSGLQDWQKRFYFLGSGTAAAATVDNFVVKKINALAPALINTTVANNATGVALNEAITLTFNMELDGETLSGITLKTKEGQAVAITPSVSGATVSIAHPKFSMDKEYVLTVPTTVRATNGLPVQEQIVINFATPSSKEVVINHTFDSGTHEWKANNGNVAAENGKLVMSSAFSAIYTCSEEERSKIDGSLVEISFDFQRTTASSTAIYFNVYNADMLIFTDSDTNLHHFVVTYDASTGAYTVNKDGAFIVTDGNGAPSSSLEDWRKRFYFLGDGADAAATVDNFVVKKINALAPALINTTVENNATNVAIAEDIVLTFNVAMDANTLSGITLTTKGGTPVAINPAVSETSITINPETNLKYDKEYVLTVPTTVASAAGMELENPIVINFATASSKEVVINHTFDSGTHEWKANNGNVAAENGKLVMSSAFSAIYTCSEEERSKIDGSLVEISFDFQRTTASSTAISFNVYNADMLTFTDSDTNLHHFVVTYDASTGAYTVNKDGVLIVTDGNGAPSSSLQDWQKRFYFLSSGTDAAATVDNFKIVKQLETGIPKILYLETAPTTSAITAGGQASATATIVNGTSASKKPLVGAALYDAQGNLRAIAITEQTIDAGKTATISATITVPVDIGTGATLRWYAFNSRDEVQPLDTINE